jgi:hypothetical protein
VALKNQYGVDRESEIVRRRTKEPEPENEPVTIEEEGCDE